MIESPQTVTDLNALSDDARVWIFQSSKPLVGDVRTDVSSTLIQFLREWAAHGRQLFAAFEIRYDRFIVIGVDEAQAQATGCSIVKLMRTVQNLDDKHDLDLLERMKVAYRAGEDIVEVDANAFAKLLSQGKANGDTRVFNNVVQTIGEYKTSWETTVKESWHRNLMA